MSEKTVKSLKIGGIVALVAGAIVTITSFVTNSSIKKNMEAEL